MIVAWSGSGRTRRPSKMDPPRRVRCDSWRRDQSPRLINATVYCKPIIPFPTGRARFCVHSWQ